MNGGERWLAAPRVSLGERHAEPEPAVQMGRAVVRKELENSLSMEAGA